MPRCCLPRMLLFALFWLNLPAVADSCETDGVCLTIEKENDKVELFIENLNIFPVKVWLDVDLKNMRASRNLPDTAIFQPKSRTKMVSLFVQDQKEKSRFNPSIKWRKVDDYWQSCVENYLCIQAELEDDIFTFFMQNTIEAPLTISFENKGFKNLEPSVTFPHVQSCAAKKRCRLFTARLVEDFGGWHYPHNIRAKTGFLNVNHDGGFIYRLPYQLGTRHRVGQGYNGDFSHRGEYAIDWNMPVGTPVYAARGGKVIELVDHYNSGGIRKTFRERGNNIKILHDDKSIGAYVHLKNNGVLVKVGDRVVQGQKIGLSGNTGYSSGPHLHFEVYGINQLLEEVNFPIKFEVGGSVPRELEEGKTYTAVSVKRNLPDVPK